jgi:hypothetical protein
MLLLLLLSAFCSSSSFMSSITWRELIKMGLFTTAVAEMEKTQLKSTGGK